MNTKEKYNKISETYDKRYEADEMNPISEYLQKSSVGITGNVLELGCGTGHWLRNFDRSKYKLFGLDLSIGMLKIARRKIPDLNIINSDAIKTPFKPNQFDLLYCVNMVHFIKNKHELIRTAKYLLKPKGKIILVGLELHDETYSWYITKYFPNIYNNDKKRFPSFASIKKYFVSEGFCELKQSTIYTLNKKFIGAQVLDDPFLDKNQSSQLASLSDTDYKNGIERIKDDITQNPQKEFSIRMNFNSLSAFLKDG